MLGVVVEVEAAPVVGVVAAVAAVEANIAGR